MGPGGVGWGPRRRPWGPYPVGPVEYFRGFADCICGAIAACLSCLCCGWLFHDCCFGGACGPGPRPFGPPLPPGPPFGPPPPFPF
ncbi:OLC1v1007533C1 [Oldenlandia corymbosa var. corymbosa]|uniref:OLC1v1007533C1 n=1 Tax=Oldenlandia corymbosa var. corymbosa TaxID=529605 RepID=A0AAV1DM35_OLDCO|nr:OLC1v1007533C1 [Oldenlandia corymbosa var. corymbosa]